MLSRIPATCYDKAESEVIGLVGWQRDSKNRAYAPGRLKAGAMNKTEQAYESLLKLRQQAGEVLWYKFEGLKFRLADNTFYTPDFVVMLASGQMEAHEVKGFLARRCGQRSRLLLICTRFVLSLLCQRLRKMAVAGSKRFSSNGRIWCFKDS